jgi:hypothetical protein
MKHLKTIVKAIVLAFILVGITNQFSSSKYPPCDLVVKGIGVSTFGCMNMPSTQSYACKTEFGNSVAMKNCINANYYKYKTFPFGYKQLFGDKSNLIDSKPKTQNEIATFTSAFLLSTLVLSLLNNVVRKPVAK